MNQRVDELAWQAGCNQVSHHDPVRPECNGWIINQETLDRFAELIVRECARASKETCDELKADESIQTPGFKTSMNLYQVTLRNRLAERFEIDGME